MLGIFQKNVKCLELAVRVIPSCFLENLRIWIKAPLTFIPGSLILSQDYFFVVTIFLFIKMFY